MKETATAKYLEGALRRVPDDVLCSAFMRGYSMAEIAQFFGVTTEAVEARLRKALFR